MRRTDALRRAKATILTAVLLSPGPALAGSLYGRWENGPPQSPAFFPIAVWWQNPTETGHSGSYPTIANAVVGTGMNIFLGIGPWNQQNGQDGWPEGFGTDHGELEAIKANNLYAIGGIETPYNEDNLPQSVASVLALAGSIGAEANVIGYNAGDEPSCDPAQNQIPYADVPGIINGISSYDPTRLVTLNETAWMLNPPQWYQQQCWNSMVKALQSTNVASFDLYPATSPWLPQAGYFPGSEGKSDFKSIPNDTLWAQGVATKALIHTGAANQPAWVYIESGSDNLGFSSAHNSFSGGVSYGSSTLTNVSGWSSFTTTWVGLTVSGGGIPANTTIVSITDATHATLSHAAEGTSANETITVTGGAGAGTDCVASANLCVVNGNEFRPTPAQVFSEVWMSLISGANGIEYFCNDTLTDSFCLGDQLGGAPASQASANIKYIDSTIIAFAEKLNSPTAGQCSMQQQNYQNGAFFTTSSCTNGMLTMATGNSAVPGLAMVKEYQGHYFLTAQSDRRSAAGATFTYTLAGLGGHTAQLVFDSDTQYDPPNSKLWASFPLNAQGQFADVLGAHGDHYQVKIYKIW